MDDDFSFDDHLDDVDLEIDIEMPETPAQRPKGRNSVQNTTSRPIIQSAKNNNKKKSTDNGFIPDNDTINTKVQQKTGEGNDRTDPEEKLATEMKDSLAECSRQRLRSLHMYLRRFGNVDNRISEKDMLLAFQENSINLTPRLFQMVCELYGGPRGVDFERLYRFLLAAHDMTGRDSVKARRQRNDLEARANVSQEARDEDFLRRIEALLIRDQTFLDIENLRSEFQSMDSHRSGKISTSFVHSTCAEKTPLYGALLDNLVKRCQEDHDGQVSWPTLLNFLEKGQQNAQKKCPELVALREKARALAAVNVAPDPMDELSSSAKSRFMTKFLRKQQATHVRENTMSPTPPVAAATPDSVTERKQEDDHPTAPDLKPEGEPATIVTDEKRKISALGKPVPVLNGTKKKTLPATRPKAKMLIAAKSTLPLIEVDKVSEGGTEASSTGAEDSAEKRKYESRKVSLNEETSKRASSSLDEGPHRHESNDTFAAQKKTSGEIETVKPKGYKEVKVPIDPPNERLQLDWVYGCRGNDCRRNLHVLVTGELAYFIANIVVLYNRAGHTQRHYREHNEDVKCMAVHSNGVTVASGQFSSKFKVDHLAHIRVWRSDLLQTLNVIGVGAFHKAVMCLAFQPNKDILAAVDNAHEKHLTVWNIGSNEVIADGYIQTDTICDMEFSPKSPDFLVTSGKEHLTWWKFSCDVKRIQHYAHPDYEGRDGDVKFLMLEQRTAHDSDIIEIAISPRKTYMKAKYVICVTHTEKGDLLTGDSNGTIYVWGDGSNKIMNFVKHGHDGPVLSLQLHHQYVISGGRDGMVCAWTWNKNMDKAAALTIPASEGGVRTLTLHNDTLVISTTMNSLLSVTMAQKGCPLDGVALDPVPITQGHFDELRGLTVISKSFLRADVLTAGTDGVLCKFNTHKHGPVWKLHMKGVAFQCVDCTTKGDSMVLGTKDGHVLALELKKADMTVVEIMDTKVSTGRLDCIRLSPDKQWFAVGGQDSAIYLFRATQNANNENGWELSGILKGHDGNITSMDWSSESVAGSLLLRTSSSVPEQKYWDVATATEVNGSQLDVIKWATDTCTLDHLVTGIWSSKQAIDGQVTCVDVNLTKSLVAMGNDQGFLSLFRFPCTQTGTFSHTYRCHQKIVSLRFSPAGDSILTIGGYDSALVQWKVV